MERQPTGPSVVFAVCTGVEATESWPFA